MTPSDPPPPGSETAPAATGDPAAREIDTWMRELAEWLAHDMRTPLGAMRMWSYVLREGKESDRAAALDAIDASVRAQSEMVSFLCDAARAVVGRLRIDKQPCDLGAIVREAADANLERARARLTTIEVAAGTPQDAALTVMGDRVRLRQAIDCLLATAIARGPDQNKLLVRAAVAGPWRNAAVVVRAPRAGLSGPEIDELFTPYRPSQTTERRVHGHFGLGPAFARSLVRSHGGDVYCAREEEEDSLVFTVRLPLAPASVAPLPAAPR